MASPSTDAPLVAGPRRVDSVVLHMVGLALVFTAAGLSACGLVEVVVGGPELRALFGSAVVAGVPGVAAWRLSRVPPRVSAVSAFAAVSWTWILVSVTGAVPFVLAGTFGHWDDAVFESVSGFTATGSTVLAPIEGHSRGLLFWRQMTQWYGGMGMIVLALAVLPLLGVGGMQLFQAEGPGPAADRLAPRVSDTAKRLWQIYVTLTALAVVAFLVVGMDLYDAAAHALTVIATGGYSPYDASIGHFDSVAVELVTMALMFVGAVNFALHWRAVTDRSLRGYWARSEFRTFVALIAGGVVVITAMNVADGMAAGRAVRDSAFAVVTVITTCGYGTADFAAWVPAAQLILVGFMVTGAMAGSTSGAVKLFRIRVMADVARRDLLRVRHPRLVRSIRLGREPVAEDVVQRIVGFFLLYVFIAILGVFALTGLGSDLPTALGSVATAMGGVGPAIGDAGPASNFLVLTRPARGVMMVLMLLGRLELFPVLLMLAAPWRAVRRQTER